MGDSRFWCWLFLILTGVQTACPMFMFPVPCFVSTTELPHAEKKIIADKLWISIKEKIEQNVNITVSFYRENLKFLFRTFLENSNESAKVSGEGSDNFFGFNTELYHLNYLIAVLYGADLAFFGNSVFHLYLRGFHSFDFAIFLATTTGLTCIPHFVHKVNVEPELRTWIQSLWDMIRSMLCFTKEEKAIIPPPEDTPMQKVLKKIYPGIDLENKTSKVINRVLAFSEKFGLSLSSIISGVILTTATTELIFLIQVYCNEDDGKRDFTVEELLEDYKDNEEFYEWLTPRRRNYSEEYDI